MAQPIPLELPVRDPRVALQARLQDAPAEHAEALLAGYEVLQGLHDSGVFDLMRAGCSDRGIRFSASPLGQRDRHNRSAPFAIFCSWLRCLAKSIRRSSKPSRKPAHRP